MEAGIPKPRAAISAGDAWTAKAINYERDISKCFWNRLIDPWDQIFYPLVFEFILIEDLRGVRQGAACIIVLGRCQLHHDHII